MKFIIALLLIICCTNLEAQIYNTNHFKIFYTKLDDRNIKEIADSLENKSVRIIKSLQSEELPIVNVHFYANIVNLQEAVKTTVPNLPSWAIGLATSVSEIKMLSPNYPKEDYQTMVRNSIHEFVHCVSLKINKTIANKPRWLWESIAIYESNQKSDPRQLSYLVNQKPPSLSEFKSLSNTYIYDVGYFIAEYLVELKGNAALNSLIKNNGNIEQTLNMDDEEFTKQWFAFVKKKYGI